MLGIAISLAATVLAGAVLAQWLLTPGRPKARTVAIARPPAAPLVAYRNQP